MRLRLPQKFGLATKFNALIVASILATTLGMGALIVREEIAANVQQLQSDGAALAAMVSQNSEYALYTQNREALQQVAAGVNAYPAVAYVRFADRDGHGLLERAFRSIGLPGFQRHARRVEGTEAAVGEFRDRMDGSAYLDVLVPVHGAADAGEASLFPDAPPRPAAGEVIGYVQLGLSQEPMRQRLRALLMHAAASAAICVLFGVTATILLTRKITAPINRLVEATRAVAEGRLDHTIRVDTRDELRELGTAFSAMLGRLRQYREQVESSQHDLERKVEQRTHELEQATRKAYDLAHQAEAAQRKGLELACVIHDGVATQVHGDPGRLRQVLINLVGNAVKFTEKGEVVVRVTSEEQGRDSSLLRFEVSDTGIGVAADAKDRIFGAFTQADGSTTRRFGGTGLGLAIAKQLAGMMSGGIGVVSDPGKGSTFWFTARLGRQRLATRRVAPRRNLQGLRVLIVDDNATNRELLQHQVASWGMKEGSADSGPKALDMLREAAGAGHPYDVGLLDMMMPGMNGIELARRIKSEGSISGVRLVLLTSVGLRGDAAEARRAKIEGNMRKPVRQSDLYNCLATVLGRPAEDYVLVTRHSLSEKAPPLQGRILLAEDNPVNQEVILAMVESLGCSVEIAGDGEEAIEKMAKGGYSLVLMDCQMPRKDGYEATTEIRRLEDAAGEKRHIPIVALTANAMEGDRERCLTSGMDDYLSKPVGREALRTVLERWIGEDPQAGAQVAAEPAPAGPQAEAVAAPKAAASAAAVPDVPPDGGAPIDMKTLESMRPLQRAGQPDVIPRVIGLYLSNAPSMMEELQIAVERGDTATVYRLAHSLKSSSAMVGALRLSALCKTLEARARETKEGAVPDGLPEIEAEYARVVEALRKLGAGGGS